MKWNPSEIGRFGFKVGRTFEMSWFTLWRREDHYDLVLFAMNDDDDEPVNTTTPLPFEIGDRIIAQAYDSGHISTWEQSYNIETDEGDPFTWSLDIAAPDESILFITHGKGGLPTSEDFAAVVAAVRQAASDFGKGFPEIDGLF